jgi:hypothetical protein
MAIAYWNSGPSLRWENAGVIRITFDATASTDYLTLKTVPGSLRVTQGFRSRIPVMDRAAHVGATEGNDQPSTVTVAVKLTKLGLTGASDLLALLCPAAGATNEVPKFTLDIDFPDGRTASTGTTLALTRCYVTGSQPLTLEGGDEHDSMELTITSLDARFTASTY